MKVLFYFAHPAQYLFARNTIRTLLENKHNVKILIKTKDVLETLLKNDGFEYVNILPKERGYSKLSMAFSLFKRNLHLLPIVLKFKPDLLMGTDTSIAHIGWLLNINRITIVDDDYEITKTFSDITYPFTQTILCPEVCRVGRWVDKKVGYEGYMKLAYLHPNIFTFDKTVVGKYIPDYKYVIIRLAKLTAFHDFGIRGITNDILDKIINTLEKKSFKVYLSIEGIVDKKYEPYILKINPNDIHHLLANASIFICDSQSMSLEASILGVPSLRISDFVGKISVLEELEHKYGLTFGIRPDHTEKIFEKLDELLSIENLKEEFRVKKNIMLQEKIDVSAFLTWFIENYPKSREIMKKDPTYQKRFIG